MMSITIDAILRRLRKNELFNNAYERIFNSEAMVKAGKTPYQILYDDGLATLHYYPPEEGYSTRFEIPVLFVMPLAINMYIYDLFPNRSLIRYMVRQGFKVYLVNWGKPKRYHTKRNFSTYVTEALPDIIAIVKQHSQSTQYSLHGWSMAGLFVTLYAAWAKDDTLENLIVQGSPIDSYASGFVGKALQAANVVYNQVNQITGFDYRQLPRGFFHSYGWMNALSFKMLDPIGTLKGYWQVMQQLDDRDAVESHATISAFLNQMVDYPDGIIRDMVFKIWLKNDLVTGKTHFFGQDLNLHDIKAKLLVVGGTTDTLVTIESARPLIHLVGSVDKAFVTSPGGHMGMMSSSATSREFWPVFANWLAKRSQPLITGNDQVRDIEADLSTNTDDMMT